MSKVEAGFGIGASVRRTEDKRFVTGRGRYVDDMAMPRQSRAAFVRSPHAHAIIRHIDTDAARAAPGVVAVFTGSDLRASGVGGLPSGWLLRDRFDAPLVEPPHYPLAIDRTRHIGDPVAVVIAETVDDAKSAAELVVVDYEPLAAVTDARQAILPGAPLVWEEAAANVGCDWVLGDAKAVEAAFAAAVHVTSLTLHNNRLVQNPMEPRAALADYDQGTGRYTLYITSQNPHAVRTLMSAVVLGIPEQALRVISPDVGGGFGAKIAVYPEEAVITWATSRVHRPIKWTADRSEGFLTDAQGRDHSTVAELALDAEGMFLGLRVVTLANVGAYLYGGGAVIPTYYYAPLLSGVYRIPAIHANVKVVFTNTVPVDAYRGAGRPEATYLLERIIDKAAIQLGIDRVSLRRRNFIPASAFPYQTPLGLEYDSGDHEATLAIALKAADWDGFPARQRAAAERGLRRGIGISTYVEIAGGVPSRLMGQMGARGGRMESALVRVHPSGAVTVFSGSHSHGQGHETAFAQLVCHKLGVPFDSIRIVQGDTDAVPYGRGTAASRSLVVGGSAILEAADRIIDKGRKIASYLLESAEPDISFTEGEFRVTGTDRSVTFAAVAKAAYTGHDFPADAIEHGLESLAFYDPKNWTCPGGCYICELEVDPDTGVITLCQIVAVDDLGTIVNPMIVEGQIHGGIVQGVGQALLEHAIYDDNGQLVTGSFSDYCMPRADDLPFLDVSTHATPCEHTPLKAKGCAEVGSVGVPPAIINAVIDALRPLGVTDISMPATSLHVWQSIRSAGGIGKGP